MLAEFLPYFSVNELPNAFIVTGAISALLPSHPAPSTVPLAQPNAFFPTLFHLWAIVNRSKVVDVFFVDLFSRFSRDHLTCSHVSYGEYGIFSKEQADIFFTTILRLTQIPVGQSGSQSTPLDLLSGAGILLAKEEKKHPVAYMVARLIVNSLSPACLDTPESMLTNLEGLMDSIETFFHPSNQGSWATILGQLTLFLTDAFVSRWNREQCGELDVPEDRKITPELKRRFVMALREPTYMGIFSKSSRVSRFYYIALQGLSYLEPDLILPGALQRFYPSLQGLVEVHRTQSSLIGLQMICNIMSKLKGYRCHITALLALALPGIDANDLEKTQYTLYFIQSVAYSIPIAPLSKDGELHDTNLAMQWVQGEMERMERDGTNVQMNYGTELSDEDEANILRSSTAGFGEFILALLGKIFTLLENLPDANQGSRGTPEDDVISALSAAMSPLFASMSPEIYDMAMDKIAAFVSSHVVHQARDPMARLLNAVCKVNPAKALKIFIPMLIVNIRNEIDDNHAASDRTTGTDYLPRDRALVWNISMLAMAVVHVGREVLNYKDELLGIVEYMQDKVRGLPTLLVSNFTHHLLLNLTHTYPIDHSLFEPEVMEKGLDVANWGQTTSPSELTIKWHHPSPPEIDFAIELFASQTKACTTQLDLLLSDKSPVSRSGKHKEWSDDVSRLMEQIWLGISGMAALFDPTQATGTGVANGDSDAMDVDEEGDSDPLAEVAEDESLRPQFKYPAGYALQKGEPAYIRVHELREQLGRLLTKAHAFLTANQEDDVKSFTSLYSAYRAWVTDVGFERSAHGLERHVNLYKSYIAAFKIKGLRKVYPRPLLIRRAEAYLLLRMKRNSTTRRKSALDKQLLLDLAQSCLSSYADIRRAAQSAQDSALRSLIGGRPIVIPSILNGLSEALEKNDHDRIKGGLYSLFFTSLHKTIIKDWRFAPQAMRLYIEIARIDKPSIETLSSSAVLSLYEFGKPFERAIVVNQDLLSDIKPTEDVTMDIKSRFAFIVKRRAKVEAAKADLGLELTQRAKGAHWKVASRCALFASNLSLRFSTIAPAEFIELVTSGANDAHPGLRMSYVNALTGLFTTIDTRAVYGHDYMNYILDNDVNEPNRLEIAVDHSNPHFTKDFLDSFNKSGDPEYLVDADYPGWLVWGKSFTAFRAKPLPFDCYDDLERSVRKQLGQVLTKEWLAKCFEYLKQEPRDNYADRVSMTNVYLLMHIFTLMYYKETKLTFEDVKELVAETFGDGSDKHQHRATSEILGALLGSATDEPIEIRDMVWSFAAPKVLEIFTDELTPENLQYWLTCLHHILDTRDPRRYREIAGKLESYRIDITSNAAFKEASKIQLLEIVIGEAGWHFRREEPIMADFLTHLDHPYKAVREAIGRVLSVAFRSRNHESFNTVKELLEANAAASSVGIRPFAPSKELTVTLAEVFKRLETWRHERQPGQQTQSAYTSGSKTVLAWLDCALASYECIQLAPFFTMFMNELLHMMDVKEDPELMRLAYHVYRYFPNIPLRQGEDTEFIQGLVKLGRTATSWHQRLRALVNMQVVYFRRLFLTREPERDLLFMTVSDMLVDPALEVRGCAATTLAGMIRCSPQRIREPMIAKLRERFEKELDQNPMPKRKPNLPGTETPVDLQKQIIRRHAAVLGLGALIEAFPYTTPPPKWMPEVLALVARRAAGDSAPVGKSAKSILSDFKKTRQDSWSVDQKYFTTEQLEDLEGVLWKSYFA